MSESDLLVFVVGVVIALWVNILNESREESNQEKAYLAGILVYLKTEGNIWTAHPYDWFTPGTPRTE